MYVCRGSDFLTDSSQTFPDYFAALEKLMPIL
uniref:Uncharacterized protein n=1 Tax=Anguilla anguilla TaxID=7936 RepID=A0A0E9QH97_ANGAN